jgi:hypothetical protein
MFITDDVFDMSVIYLIRSMIKNFLIENPELEFNGMKFKDAIIADAYNLDDYIENIVMAMG